MKNLILKHISKKKLDDHKLVLKILPMTANSEVTALKGRNSYYGFVIMAVL